MITITAPFAITIEKFDQPTLEITDKLIDQLMSPIRRNQIAIFETTAAVERYIDKILCHYFYGSFNEQNRGLRDRFLSLVLSSDWCSFSSKRKLILHVIHEQQLLEGKEKDNYDKVIRRLMSIRNSFAHGKMSTDGRIVKLSYHEGKSQSKLLTTEYFTEIEEVLHESFQSTKAIINKLGIVKVIDP